MIDIDKGSWNALEPTIYALLKGFIPGMDQALHDFKLLQDKDTHSPFRVIIAGRYLYKRLQNIREAGEFTPFSLTPFTYEPIRDATNTFLGRRDTDQIVAHLMHHTAGHPGCIARVLQMYRDQGQPPADDFFSSFADEILERIVYPEAEDVRENVDPTLLGYLDGLSTFRYLNEDVLRIWMLRLVDSNRTFSNECELADRLVESGLMAYEKDSDLLRDSITRRLLAIRLLGQTESHVFIEQCQLAQAVCLEYLQELGAQSPHLWVLEALFQSLQQHSSHIQDAQKRAKIKQVFLVETVPHVLGVLTDNRVPRKESRALDRALETDWEFRFTVNYFLREERYTAEPYQSLKQGIKDFFTTEVRGQRGS